MQEEEIIQALKAFFEVQSVTAVGNSIAEVLTSGYTQLYNATITSDSISEIIQQCADTGTF